jgi:hypothetical protein
MVPVGSAYKPFVTPPASVGIVNPKLPPTNNPRWLKAAKRLKAFAAVPNELHAGVFGLFGAIKSG